MRTTMLVLTLLLTTGEAAQASVTDPSVQPAVQGEADRPSATGPSIQPTVQVEAPPPSATEPTLQPTAQVEAPPHYEIEPMAQPTAKTEVSASEWAEKRTLAFFATGVLVLAATMAVEASMLSGNAYTIQALMFLPATVAAVSTFAFSLPTDGPVGGALAVVKGLAAFATTYLLVLGGTVAAFAAAMVGGPLGLGMLAAAVLVPALVGGGIAATSAAPPRH